MNILTRDRSVGYLPAKGWLWLFTSTIVFILNSLTPIAAQGAESEYPASALPDIRLEHLPEEISTEVPFEITTPAASPSRAPAGAEKIRFVLAGLNIKGATVYSQADFELLYTEFLDEEVSLTQVYDFVAAIQRMYRRDGYFLTRVILPPQTTRDGRLSVIVIEGHISTVKIQGDIGPVKEKVESYLSHILDEKPLKLETLERYLLLVRDIPGINVDGILSPAPDTPGAAQLVATVERKRFDGFALVDNIGTTFTGNWEIAGGAMSNSATRYGEQFSITGLVSDPLKGIGSDKKNQKVVQLGASLRPGSQGHSVVFLGSYGDSNPGGIINQFNFDSKALLLSIIGSNPIIRSRERNLSAALGFDYINNDTDIFNNIKFSRDRLRVLHLSATTDFLDKWRGSNFAQLGIRQGLPIMDASESDDEFLSRANGSGTFTSLQAAASRLQTITGPFAVFLSVAGQYSFSDLLTYEEFAVGGVHFGRGYDPKELSNDDGVGFTGEFQFTRPATLWPLQSYQLFAFYDFGKVWDHSSNESSSLSSAGGGVRMWAAHDTSVSLQLAKPLTRDSLRADNSRDTQLLFRAITRF